MSPKPRKLIFDLYDPESPVGTEFRRLLHNITRATKGKERKSFLTTSAMLSEGKSTVSAYLALTSAAYKSHKTVLVDCDLRRPSIHRLFGLPLEGGVTDVIDGKLSAEEAFKGTKVENLWVLTAGTLKKNPTELFESQGVKKVVEQLKFYFELVFVDCAPIIPVSDPVELAPELDGVLLVIKAGTTQSEVILRAADIVQKADAEIVGVVLNNMNSVLPYFYNHSYYGYSYTSRGR
jgi:capsular exopolysaccharide synthesis family protein